MKRGVALPAELASAFAEFWAAYPKRSPNPRALAEAAFAAAVKAGAKPAELVAAAGAYAAECRAKGVREEFIVHARTFLAQRRFLDYLAPATAGQVVTAGAVEEPTHPWWPAFRGRISPASFAQWIVPLLCVGGEIDAEGQQISVKLNAPTAFHRDYVRERYNELLKAALHIARIDWEAGR